MSAPPQPGPSQSSQPSSAQCLQKVNQTLFVTFLTCSRHAWQHGCLNPGGWLLSTLHACSLANANCSYCSSQTTACGPGVPGQVRFLLSPSIQTVAHYILRSNACDNRLDSQISLLAHTASSIKSSFDKIYGRGGRVLASVQARSFWTGGSAPPHPAMVDKR